MTTKHSRKVLYAYKDEHWHTQWNALFECGHWGYTANRMMHTSGHAQTGQCYQCKQGKPRDEAALAKFHDDRAKGIPT